jgi:hypothetical protein
MTAAKSSTRIWRSVGAVLAGVLVGALLSLGVDVILHALHFFPPWGEPVSSGPLAAATAYRAVFGILGAYVTARLAPSRPMAHALILGALGTVVSAAGAIATWNKGPAFGPHWYPVALVVIGIPCAWLGGVLAQRAIPNNLRVTG